jgi:putative ABC transport system ATP-binding protein
MSAAAHLIEMSGVSKEHGGACPLRIAFLCVDQGDRRVISGLDQPAAETFFHLVSGAALADTGTVLVAGADTRTITTDTDWLLSLDRFGFMTNRAVLLESLSVAANLALPMTLAVEPMAADVEAQVNALADEVELPRSRLPLKVTALTPLERARLHLGRALGPGPSFLLLEHPTDGLGNDTERRAFGRTLHGAAATRNAGWLALSNDSAFAAASRGRHERLDLTTGETTRVRRWWFWN